MIVASRSAIIKVERFLMLLILVVIYNTQMKAQITIFNSTSALDIAQTLMGNSVKIDSAKILCDQNAFAKFSSNNVLNLPFTEGVLLTTGNASAVDRSAVNNLMPGLIDFNLNTPGNSFLNSLSNQSTEDACEVEVYLKPIGNQLHVDYIFGSEEYPEQVNKFYYDAFAFIVNGPRPTGGWYNDTNIAKVGNGQVVTVATINNGPNNAGPCSNCNFYNNNSTNPKLGYDGLTTPLSSSISVKACENYKVNIVIADVRDGKYDSGVFLNKGAINSTGATTINASQTKICKGQNVSLTASSAITQNFSWNTGATGSQINVEPLTSTYYTCYYEYCGVSGFEIISIEVDTINKAPSYDLNSDKLCKNDSMIKPLHIYGSGVFESPNPNLVFNQNGEINVYLSNLGAYQLNYISSDALCPGVFSKSIEIVPAPSLSVSGGLNYCSNEPIKPLELTASGKAPYNFIFYKDSILTDTNSVISNLSLYLGNGIYNQFKLKDANGCIISENSEITQIKMESPVNEFLVFQNDSCSSSGIKVQNLSSIDRATIQQYKWELNGNTVSMESEFQFPTYPSGNYILSLYALADNGCSDRIQKNIFIKPNPQANFIFNSPCFGDSVLIKSTSFFNSTLGKINWTLNNSTTHMQTSIINPTYLAYDTSMRVVLNVINDFGCRDSLVKNIKTIPLPKSHFSFQNVCVGDTLIFKNLSSTLTSGTLFYSWDIFNDGVVDYLSKDFEYYSEQPQKFWIKLFTRDEFGCKSNIMQMAEIYPKPEVKFAITDSSGCVPFRFGTLNNSSIASGSSLSKYKWTLSNGASFVGFQPEFKINEPGKYTVQLEVTSSRNCSRILTSDSVIRGYAKTKPEFIVYPEELSTINNIANIEFRNTQDETWIDFNNQIMTSQEGILNLNVLDSGWHRIIGFQKNEHGCIDTSEKWVYVKSDYGLYIPNSFTPNYDGFNERFCVVSNGIIRQDYLFRIFNRFNEEIFASTTLNECWDGRLKNGDMVPVGVYIYEVTCRTENRVEKFYKGTFSVIR